MLGRELTSQGYVNIDGLDKSLGMLSQASLHHHHDHDDALLAASHHDDAAASHPEDLN